MELVTAVLLGCILIHQRGHGQTRPKYPYITSNINFIDVYSGLKSIRIPSNSLRNKTLPTNKIQKHLPSAGLALNVAQRARACFLAMVDLQ